MPTHIRSQGATKRAGVSTMVDFSNTGHPKCAAALVKNLLHMTGIITDDTSIAINDTQPDEMRHDIDIVKELVRRQTHKSREIRRFGPYEHLGFLPRSSIDPGWWHWRRVFGAPWKGATEHITQVTLLNDAERLLFTAGAAIRPEALIRRLISVFC